MLKYHNFVSVWGLHPQTPASGIAYYVKLEPSLLKSLRTGLLYIVNTVCMPLIFAMECVRDLIKRKFMIYELHVWFIILIICAGPCLGAQFITFSYLIVYLS